MSDKLQAALDLARRGFPVFPLAPNTKLPRAGSHGCKDATLDESRIRQWWSDEPDGNIGISTDDFVVLDVDPRRGGHTTLKELQLYEELPKTLVARTQSGGAHIVFARNCQSLVRGGNDLLGPGIDVKSYGGYIVGAGSTIDGKSYIWANERKIDAAAPWILERCKARRERAKAAGKRIIEEDDTAVALAEAWIDKHAPVAHEGKIDDTAFKVAARCYDYGVSIDTCIELLLQWSDTKSFPPMEMKDIERVAKSASRNRDNAIGSRHPSAEGFEAVDINVVSLRQSESNQTKFASFTAAEGVASETTPRRYLIKGLLEAGTMSVLFGPSGEGKTFNAYDLAYHLGKGRAWRGKKTRQVGVVYLATEGGQGAKDRLKAMSIHYKDDMSGCRMHVIPTPADFLHGKEDRELFVKQIAAIEKEHGYKIEVVIIDTLSRVLGGGDENSSVDMGVIVKAIDEIRAITGAHVMSVHHTGKQKDRGARGWSGLRAACDTEIEVDNGCIRVTKQRDLETNFKAFFRLKPVRVRVDEDGDDVKSCFVESMEQADPWAAPVGDMEPELKMLRKHLDDSQCDKTEFTTAELIEAMRQIHLSHGLSYENNPTSVRRHFERLATRCDTAGHMRKLRKGLWVFRPYNRYDNMQQDDA